MSVQLTDLLMDYIKGAHKTTGAEARAIILLSCQKIVFLLEKEPNPLE